MKGLFLFLLLLGAAGCASANAPSLWPYRGPFVCVRNDRTEPLHVVARDALGRELPIRRLHPGEHITFRWPFVASRGRLLAHPFYSQEFEPWTSHYWTWKVGEFSVWSAAVSRPC